MGDEFGLEVAPRSNATTSKAAAKAAKLAVDAHPAQVLQQSPEPTEQIMASDPADGWHLGGSDDEEAESIAEGSSFDEIENEEIEEDQKRNDVSQGEPHNLSTSSRVDMGRTDAAVSRSSSSFELPSGLLPVESGGADAEYFFP